VVRSAGGQRPAYSVLRAVDSHAFHPSRQSPSSAREIRAAVRVGPSIRCIVAMAGEHVVDSLRDSHRPTVGTYGLILKASLSRFS
jgi:hypothetical protein